LILEPEVVEGPALVWRFGAPVRAIASTVLGGGIGVRRWVCNATVPLGYREPDPAADAGRRAAAAGLDGDGCVLLTGVDVRRFVAASHEGAEVVATVGLGTGTINVVAWVPEPLADAALVNLVATIAEAKAQAFARCGVPGTGTPTDASVVCCPAGAALDDDAHRYGGPASTWGARVAAAALDAVAEGIEADRAHGGRPRTVAPPAGAHGGDGAALAAALGVGVDDVLDLSASLNPCPPDVTAAVARHLGALRRYPDASGATAALADAVGVDPHRVVLTNGGAEAIALVAAVLGQGHVEAPEFSLYERHLEPGGGRWRSNPRSPTGELAGPDERAAVWDEAFYPLATGRWTRGDDDAVVVGSLTKLLACPGLRIGYVLAPSAEAADAVRRRQPMWSVNGVACAVLPELLAGADLPTWAAAVGELRQALVAVLDGHDVHAADAPWVLVRDAGDLRERLARRGVLVRDCSSFGLHGTVRIAVPDEEGLGRLAAAMR
jgi:histidinol-phosphate/aromatic aminotransferase/cobyric acid decarboxylase-like protein/adenosylcobinamide amidohydrolase